MSREERIESKYQSMSAWNMATEIVDLEDYCELQLSRYKELEAKLEKAKELDPSRLEATLRLYISELNYDLHKAIESPAGGGPDGYPEEVGFFLQCWGMTGEES